MLEKQFTGMISSVSAKVKAEDGSPMKIDVLKVKLESANIDYESIAEFNPSISSTLLNIQPMPFKSINFGDQTMYQMGMEVSVLSESNDTLISNYGNVEIPQLLVNVRDNIPVFIFMLEIPATYDNNFLIQILKQKIEFKFFKMEQS
jgi:hypothetical protein